MQHIYIISKHTLFRKGLDSLLRRNSNFELVGQSEGVEKAVQEIQTLSPDVVIVDVSPWKEDDLQPIVEILRLETNVTVVGLSLHNNQLRVYQTEKRVVSGIDDLAAAIDGQTPTLENSETPALSPKADDVEVIHVDLE